MPREVLPFDEPRPSLPSSLLPWLRPEPLSMPDDPTEPVRRLGSLDGVSLRPMLWPNSADESLFDCPIRDDVERLTSPALVLCVLWLILSRLRFSIGSSMFGRLAAPVFCSAMEVPKSLIFQRNSNTTATV
jgi:hypothetical protein